MVDDLDSPSGARRWLAPVAMTLGAWLAAFLVVVALLSLFDDQLGSLPLAPRALVMSGVLVALMVNLVMPVLSVAVARWVASTPPERLSDGGPGADPTTRAVAEHHPRARMVSSETNPRRRLTRDERAQRPVDA